MKIIKNLRKYKKEKAKLIESINKFRELITKNGLCKNNDPMALFIGTESYNKLLETLYLDLLIYTDKNIAVESILNLKITVNDLTEEEKKNLVEVKYK